MDIIPIIAEAAASAWAEPISSAITSVGIVWAIAWALVRLYG